LILAGFAAAGSWRPGVSFKPAAPTQLSSCLGESWEAVSARKELQIERVLSVFDQELAISVFFDEIFVFHHLIKYLIIFLLCL